MDAKLKPCPFCGGEGHKAFRSGKRGRTPVTQSSWFRGSVKCSGCGASAAEKNNPEAAIEAWNRRDGTALNESREGE